jgi:ornithine cyclodeaminase/alanine dehydrogenase-like protein (mu-crystallin family)
MALFLTEQDVRELVTVRDAVDALEAVHKRQGEGAAVNEPRRRVRARRESLHIMAAGDTGAQVVGFKASYYAGGQVHVFLYDTQRRTLAAIVQAALLGAIRTGAASGLATKYLAREDAQTMGIIGTGSQARAQVEAVCAVRPIREVRAYSRDEGRRKDFAERVSNRLGILVRPVGSAREAADADIVTTATTSATPVLLGEWLSPGVHINAIGSNALVRRELDLEAVKRADVIVVDDRDQAAIESGDLLEAWERGVVDRARLPELGDLVAGRAPGRTSAQQVTLFESHGIGLWDVAVAEVVYRRALEQGRGVETPV